MRTSDDSAFPNNPNSFCIKKYFEYALNFLLWDFHYRVFLIYQEIYCHVLLMGKLNYNILFKLNKGENTSYFVYGQRKTDKIF